jgi:arsenate reductase
MSTVILYGIKNCDTVRKARQWLKQNNVDYHFHDIREDGLSPAQVKSWVDELGWESLVNKRSATWKTLDPSVRESLDGQSVVEVIVESPTLMKRPLLDTGKQRYTGFVVTDYEAFF